MESYSLSEQNSVCIEKSSVILNIGINDQNFRISSVQGENQCTDIFYNPYSNEINIRFKQTKTLPVKTDQNIVASEPVKKASFWELFDQYIESKRSQYSTSFIKQLRSTRNNLKRFLDNKQFEFDDIDIQFLDRFRAYYIGKLGNTLNSFAGNIKRLKFFLHYALQNGWSKNEQFKQFKAPERYGKVEYLNWEELMKLYDQDYKKDSLNKARDCFVFQSLIGCRYQDLKKLTIDNYRDGNIKFISQKTGTQIEIPLSGIAKDILNNYSGFNSKSLLPVPNIGRYNKLLKLFVFAV